MSILAQIVILLTCYVWGSIPFGYVITKHATNKNILLEGSGNIGSTNVDRIAGKKMSLLTQMLDIAKGLVPTTVVMMVDHHLNENLVYFVPLFCILGHDFSIFLKLKGGKGVNTTIGATILLAPIATLCGVAIYYIMKKVTKYVSLSSIFLSITIPIVAYVTKHENTTIIFLSLYSLLIIICHRNNIERILKGTETRV